MRLKLQQSSSFRRSACAACIRVATVGILICVNESVLFSQDGLNQANNVRFVINTGGCEQQIRTVRFSADSSRVYAAGNDKRVFAWNLLPDATGHLAGQVAAKPYFWEQARGFRSVIANFELSPKNEQLAVCGQGARSYGDIVLFDVQQQNVAGILPAERPAGLGEVNAHISTVVDVDWSPSGEQLASVDISGRVHIWNVNDRTHNRTFDTDNVAAFELRHVSFLDDETLLVSQPSAAGGRVRMVDLSQAAAEPKYVPTIHKGEVLALATIPTTDRWVSSDRQQNLYFWKRGELIEKVNLNRPNNPNEQGRMAMSLHFAGPTGRYLLANVHAIMNDGTQHAELQIWDVLQNPPTQTDSLDVPGKPALTAAISPDELLVASVDDLQNTIHVFELNRDGKFAKRNERPIELTLQGTASPVQNVAFSADDSLRVRFNTIAEPERPRVFNLKSAAWESNPPIDQTRWQNSKTSPDDWTLRVPLDNPATIELSQNGQPRGTIALDLIKQGQPSSYAWITGGQPRQTRAIAIGTHLYGIYVYAMPENGRCRLLRYYRDHSGAVRSLSVSQGGKYLASGSADATVKIWSLDGLFDEAPNTFPTAAAWGGQFVIRNGQLVTGPLTPGGIAAARGLEEGDIVEKLRVSKSGANTEIVIPAQMLEAIKTAKLWQQLEFHTSRDGKPRPRFNIVPGWEPMASFMVDRRNEWAIWTPRGNYNASAAGDQLFGWVENPGPAQRGGTPKYSPAKTKRGDFERPELLRGLFADARIPERPVVDIPIIKQPELRIVSPKVGEFVEPGKPVTIVAEVQFPEERDLYQVNAFGSLIPLGDPSKVEVQQNGTTQLQWQFTPQQAHNRIKIQVHRKSEHPANSNHVEQVAYFRTGPRIDPRIPPPRILVVPPVVKPLKSELPRVFLAGIAVGGAYADHNPNTTLVAPVHDWRLLSNLFYENEGHHYSMANSEPWSLLEYDATPECFTHWVSEIKQDLSNLESPLRPTDLFVLVIGGHGVRQKPGESGNNDNFYYVGPPAYALNSERGSQGTPPLTYIPWIPESNQNDGNGSFQTFADLPCRKLVMINACHSGAAIAAQQVDRDEIQQVARVEPWKYDLKVAVRSLQSQESLVFAAAGPSQLSWESGRESVFALAFAQGVHGSADGFSAKGSCEARDLTVHLSETLHYTTHMARYLTTRKPVEPKKPNGLENLELASIKARDLSRYPDNVKDYLSAQNYYLVTLAAYQKTIQVADGCESDWQNLEETDFAKIGDSLQKSILYKVTVQDPEMSLTGAELFQFADIPLVELTEN